MQRKIRLAAEELRRMKDKRLVLGLPDPSAGFPAHHVIWSLESKLTLTYSAAVLHRNEPDTHKPPSANSPISVDPTAFLSGKATPTLLRAPKIHTRMIK